MKKILLVLFLLCLSSTAWAVNWCENANILGCYTFEGDATTSLQDKSSSGNNLTNNNSSSFTSGAKCFNSSSCYEFDGTSDRNLSVVSDDFNITTGNLTVVAYIYPDTFGQNNFGRIADFLDVTVALKGWSFYLTGANSALRIEKQAPASIFESDASVISTETLQHVAAVKNGTTATLYVNGVSKGSGTLGDPTSNTGGTFRIGMRADSNREFDGGIDEVGIFAAVLDSTDINDIVSNGLVQSATRNRFMLIN